MENQFNVFVYGTLQPGEFYYPQYCEGRVVASRPAIARGLLYDLPLGYPAMTTGEGLVHGFCLTFSDPDVLNALDDLEDYHPDRAEAENEYVRRAIKVFTPQNEVLGSAWAYLMEGDRVQQSGGVLIPSGTWSRQILNR